MDEVCGGCGAALPSGCRFCMHCGAPHHTKNTCACGHDVTNMKFCAGCGEPTRATPARSGPPHAARKGNLRLKAQELAAKKRAAAEARFAQAYGSMPHPTASPTVPSHHTVALLAPKVHAPTTIAGPPHAAQPAPRASSYVPPPPPTTYSRPTTAAASTYARPKSAPVSQPTPSSAPAYRPVLAQSSPGSSFRPHVSPPRSSPFPVQQVLPPAATSMTTHNKTSGMNANLFPMATSIATSMAPPVLPAASSSTASANQRFGPQGFVPPRFLPPEEGQNHVYSVTQTVTRSVTYTQ
ncbi:hypothetical protein SPRG_02189 [Saprolegnia parasitica CBS 223.65]|uniref:DZANK-type domain-containing protein n=1 Tax=Saprolegnia parasitica (strain CBS 223.65) TaxID=695850 RepID=A0A067D2X7_SAPPC|nr:hypothetical protein SPRG_02189 [Saprolegnia parasitica CBS 223.65]KDO33382.1 hypothetical protein SPRG_02189 [Saprolegnia parasitica CBS 223.65]|eukprot:XP_012196130.1 hypothetical protein SPRG_02189 [Saprolegnia parasitica CBS 223.65]